MKKGRKNVYEEKIKSRFEDIKKWVEQGVTEKSIAKQLGIAYSTFNKYKMEKMEFMELIKNNRTICINKIENAMYETAIGGIKTLRKPIKCKHIEYENGKRISEYEQIEYCDEEIFIPPNITAGIYLLKHWAKEKGYTNDPLTLELKNKEYKLKKKIAEENNW